MGTRGTSFTSEATVEIAGYEFSDAVIEGNTNTSILGLKTETVVGGLGIGVAGVWTDVAFVKMEFSNLKLGVNYGSIGEFHYGWKYERSPVGTFESHDTLFQIIQGAHWTDTQQTWHVSAGTSATIEAGTVVLEGTEEVALISNTASLILSAASSTLAFGASLSALTLNATSLTAVHSVQSVIASGASRVTILPASIAINAPTAVLNGDLIALGAPPVADAAVDEALADAAAMFADVEAQVAAADAAAAAIAEMFGVLPRDLL